MMQRRKLLVIDDDPAICRYLRRGLTHQGYDVAETQSEEHARAHRRMAA